MQDFLTICRHVSHASRRFFSIDFGDDTHTLHIICRDVAGNVMSSSVLAPGKIPEIIAAPLREQFPVESNAFES